MAIHSVLFVENSIGLSGSTMSLCTLLNYLDPALFEAHIAVSQPEQAAYLHRHLRRPTDTTIIAPARSLKQSRFVSAVRGQLGPHRRRLHRLVLRWASLLDLAVVTLPYTWRLYQYARNHNVSLIHQNNGFELGSVILSRLLRIPLVAYQRGDEWNSRVVRWLARGVRHYIANSVTTRGNLTALNIPAAKVSVIYPPLDLDALQVTRPAAATRASFGFDASHRTFGVLGMLLPWKGHTVFLAAAKRVFEKVPNARALIIGAAPGNRKEYEDELRSKAQHLGIAARVTFTGFRDDVPDMLQVLEVVAHTSVSPEPFGRVIAEAMAMRRPVVATCAGGPTEIIEDGCTGFLVPPNDADALADRVIALLEDRDLAERIAEAGCSEVRRRFDAQAHAKLVEQVYARVLRPRRHGRAAAERLGRDSGR